jgi:hypothetical protein
MKVYFKTFEPKKDLPFTQPTDHQTYDGWLDRDHLMVKIGEDEIALTPPITDNEYFKCEVEVLKELTLEQIKEMVQSHADKFQESQDQMKDATLVLLEDVMDMDSTMVEPLHKLLSHVSDTMDDKYSEPFGAIDLAWLRLGGNDISAGFNVGSAAAYLKRYLSHGFDKSRNPEDLVKAIHFLLFEISGRQMDVNGTIEP